jgi:hypothetical protein
VRPTTDYGKALVVLLCVAAFADAAGALAQEPKPDAAPAGPRPDPAPSGARRSQAPPAATSPPVATSTPTAADAVATPVATVPAAPSRPRQSSRRPRGRRGSSSARIQRVQRSRRTSDEPSPARRSSGIAVPPRLDRPVAEERGKRSTDTFKLGAIALAVLVALNFAGLRLTLTRLRKEALL